MNMVRYITRSALCGGGVLLLLACGDLTAMMGGDTGLSEATREALKKGDLPAVGQDLGAKDPQTLDIEQINALAFVYLSEGKLDQADKILVIGQEKAKEDPATVKQLYLRRALVAMQRGPDAFTDVERFATESGLPEGKLLAAECAIIRFGYDDARRLLQEVQEVPGAVGGTAKGYLELLDKGGEYEALAEMTALWALGNRKSACEQAAESIPDDLEQTEKARLQLLWAGRAVTSGHPAVANELLAAMAPSPELTWRRQAVKGMVMIAEGDFEGGIALFDDLDAADAPADGVADARVTAAALTKEKEVARRLIGDLESVAPVVGLWEVGAMDLALEAAPDKGPIKRIME